MNEAEIRNFKQIEKHIHLAPLDRKKPGEDTTRRKRRTVPADRRKWLDVLKAICYPFFNENRPKATGNWFHIQE
jgi:hypothetical protein